MEKNREISEDQECTFMRHGVTVLRDRIKRTTRERKEQESTSLVVPRKQFTNLRKSVEEITADLIALDVEDERLELEKELDARLLAFREMYVAWMLRDITLDELLTAMMASGLCNRLSPFR